MRTILQILAGLAILAVVAGAVVLSLLDSPDPGRPQGPGAESGGGHAAGPAVGTGVMVPGNLSGSGKNVSGGEAGVAGGVSGTVMDEAGRPLASARVVLMPTPDGEPGGSPWSMEPGRGGRNPAADLSRLGRQGGGATGETREDGAFRLQPEGQGPFSLSVTLSGYASVRRTGIAAGTKDLVVVMAPGGRVSGTILAKDGAIVVGARAAADTSTAVPSESGEYVLEDLPSGEVEVFVSAPAFTLATRTVMLEPGGSASGIDFVLEPGPGLLGRVLDAAGGPLEGANVVLSRGFETGGFATTDANGRFALAEPKPGTWNLRATHERYGVANLPNVAYRAGERRTGLEIRMREPGRIAGTVLGAGGSPVAGALLTASSAEDSAPADLFRRTATTGADGAFSIDGLSPGVYEVAASAPGHVPVRKGGLEVVEGETTPLELTLQAGLAVSGRVVDRSGKPVPNALVMLAPEGIMPGQAGGPPGPTASAGTDGSFTLGGLTADRVNLRAVMEGYAAAELKDVEVGATDVELVLRSLGSLSGIVRLAEGQVPLESFEVDAIPATSQLPGVPGFQAAGRFVPLGEGRFRITDLEPGSYTVSIYADDLLPARQASVVVSEGEETGGLVFDVEAGATLFGVVVAGAGGSPVEGAEVGVDIGGVPMLAMTGIGRKRTARTDPRGAFEILGLPEGAASVRVTHPGYSDLVLPNVRIPPAENLVLELLAGGTVVTRVLTVDGAPVAETMVVLQRNFPFSQLMGTTDAAGEVRFEHVAPGSYMAIKVNAAAIARRGQAGMDLEIATVDVKDGEVSEVEIRAKAGTTVRGRVTRGGTAVVGTQVLLTGSGEMANALSGFKFGMTTEGGAFEIPNVEPGKYSLLVQQPGAVAPGYSRPLEVVAGRETTVDIDLPLGKIAGTVLDEEGKPVPGAQVMIVPEGLADFRSGDMSEALKAMSAMTTTDGEGRFVAQGLAAGTFVARVWQEGYSAAYSDPFETPEVGDGPQDIRVRLGRGSELEVAVSGPDGGSVANAWVYVTDAGGRLVPTSFAQAVQTDTSGVAVVRLPPGAYSVEVQASDYPAARQDVTVSSGGRSSASIRLDRGGVLDVFVTAGGTPVPEVRVDIFDAAGRPVARRITADFLSDRDSRTRTDESGRIRFPLLGAGTYRVTATEGTRSAEGQARVAAGSTAEIRLELK